VGTHVVNVDLVRVRRERGDDLVLAWGDEVDVLEADSHTIRIRLTGFVARPDGSVEPRSTTGVIRRPSRASGLKLSDVLIERDASRVLKVDFVDVQQGDGSVIETPSGRVILVDGGDNQLFARYLAARFRGTSETAPRQVDCIVITHGDADHFAGLTEIFRSEKNDNPLKRLFIQPSRVYHNGLVKRPSSVREADRLGATRSVGGKTVVTGLVADPRDVPDAEMNTPFRAWKRALAAYTRRGGIDVRNVAGGDHDAFDFLADEVQVEVLGPILTREDGAVGLSFLGAPRTRFGVGHESARETEFVGKSASHTINGHSIVLRLTYGDWRFLYSGDLNEEAEGVLLREHEAGRISLEADVFKVPHHGSADYSPPFLQAVAPVVSVVSSGDESARKEFIHPRATLMSALGRASRGDDPLVFVTELVAFFEVEGWAERVAGARGAPARSARRAGSQFFAFSRAAFGIVKIRTDGDRLLVFTNSGQVRLKEAYAYEKRNGRPVAVPVRSA